MSSIRRGDFNYVFSNLDKITKLPISFKQGKWYGACYLNGDKHKRWNKTVGYMRDGKVYIGEQGGEFMNITKWMVAYAGCADWKEAYDVMFGKREAEYTSIIREVKEEPLRFVSQELAFGSAGDCNLKKFLEEKFGKDRVDEVWKRYRVGSKFLRSGAIATVFWYIQRGGSICHDKSMLYKIDGHRDKVYGGGRRYKVGFGYRGKAYFGEHLLEGWDGKVAIVESEKTALVMSLVSPNFLWLAAGGSNMLRDVGENWKIYRDYDNAGFKWQLQHENQCVRWWNRFEGVEKGMDISDAVLEGLKRK